MQSSNASTGSSIPSNYDTDEEDMDQVFAQELAFEINVDQGELKILQETLEARTSETARDSSVDRESASFATSQTVESSYGKPLSPEEAARAVPPGDEGLIRYALVLPDNFSTNGKLLSGLNKRDFDMENGAIKPRRPSLPITMSDLLTSLTKVTGEDGPRYIFNGVLNGWPSLRQFELIEIDKKRSLGPLTPPDYFHTIKHTWSKYWSSDKEGKEGISPAIRDRSRVYRAKLRGAPWTSLGWSPESPGFLFWYEAQRPEGPRVVYGLNAVKEVGNDLCTMVHMISHRYAHSRESPKDKLTYHSIVLLEWEHGKFSTVVEGAFLNGIGGYKGRSNWYHDKDESTTELYKSMPPEMISPWLTTAAELRCYDVEAKNLDEMKVFIQQYTGHNKRFIDPRYTFSHSARLSYRSRSNIAHYLLNYIGRDCGYSELSRNCQTFAADLCSFLAGKKDVVPFHPVNRVEYHNRSHLFLYDSSMFTKRKTLQGRLVK
ncbi:hypothetical protein IV203_005680 [Nitzschia inconspicua]|uniref:Uncharacterized protein n=1 Tax=Nitzschia inconspicua TaxID=303405 RepID=A0A9K3KNJ9_9STRA|nr:hypothetical protein IV203_005680 [Nitzschia inconspicua]